MVALVLEREVQRRARRAELDVFLDWFNEVWKLAPNAIEAELERPEPDHERIATLSARMRSSSSIVLAQIGVEHDVEVADDDEETEAPALAEGELELEE